VNVISTFPYKLAADSAVTRERERNRRHVPQEEANWEVCISGWLHADRVWTDFIQFM